MFIGAPKATRSPYEGRDRAYTIEQMISTTLYEPNPTDSHQRNKTRPTNSPQGTTRYIKIQERTKTLLFRLLLLGIYITSGAAIFHVIESRNDEQDNFCHSSVDSKIEIKMAEKFNVSLKDIRKIVHDLCMQFEASHRCKYSHNDWSYYQSLYFVGSVTTTIGYGHLAPKTQAGRLFLIFYAFFGIPINLLTLQSVGEHINACFHKLIAFVEKKLYKTNTVRHEHIKTFVLSVILMILMLPMGGLMYYYSEKEKGWTYLDSVYYSFVAMSTIGFGDLVPNEGKEPKSTYEQVMWFIRLLFLGLGLSLVSSVFTSVSGATKQIKSAYMSKKGLYRINREGKHTPIERRSFKKAACTHVKDLLCNANVERTSRNGTASPLSDVYSRFEDEISTTSLSINQSQPDNQVTGVREQSRSCRSVSLSYPSSGIDCIGDSNTNSSKAVDTTRRGSQTPHIETSGLELNIIASIDESSIITNETSLDDVNKETSSQYVKCEDNENITTSTCNGLNVKSSGSDSEVDNEIIIMDNTLKHEDTNIITDTEDSSRNRPCALVKNNCRDDIVPSKHVINEITA